VSGETLLVPVRGQVAQCDHIFILNRTGSFLWSRLDGTRTVDELVCLVSETFEGATEQDARADVETFLASMEDRRLIRWIESP